MVYIQIICVNNIDVGTISITYNNNMHTCGGAVIIVQHVVTPHYYWLLG